MSDIVFPVQSALSEKAFNALWAHADSRENKTHYEAMAEVMGAPSDIATAGNIFIRKNKEALIASDIIFNAFADITGKHRSNYTSACVIVTPDRFCKLAGAFNIVTGPDYQSDMAFPIEQLMTKMALKDPETVSQDAIANIIPGMFIATDNLKPLDNDPGKSFKSFFQNPPTFNGLVRAVFGINLDLQEQLSSGHPGHKNLTGTNLTKVAELISANHPEDVKNAHAIAFLYAAHQINPNPFKIDRSLKGTLRDKLSASEHQNKASEDHYRAVDRLEAQTGFNR